MMTDFFSLFALKSLVRSSILHDTPVYVQFYITARCNLTCLQCNVRYANADLPECTLSDVKRIAENMAKIGVAMVLLTGGEPFARKDLPEIIREFVSRGIHVRMQTNGLADTEAIHKAIEYGGNDISISLDSLNPKTQEEINGGFPGSWHRALRAMATFSNYLPKQRSFASLGCVMQPKNLNDVTDVIKFGTKIGWYTSLVPIHITHSLDPRGFRTYDRKLAFQRKDYPSVKKLLSEVRSMRNGGYLLYDSDQYLDDIFRFVKHEPTSWRNKHGGVCDSPNLYFAILPNGDFAPCCDWRMAKRGYSTAAPDFPRFIKDNRFRKDVFSITSACNGCMYGSYPEMTISLRQKKAFLQRVKTFFTPQKAKPWPLEYDRIVDIAENIRFRRSEIT